MFCKYRDGLHLELARKYLSIKSNTMSKIVGGWILREECVRAQQSNVIFSIDLKRSANGMQCERLHFFSFSPLQKRKELTIQ